jgi:hypothetical protein
MWLGLQSNFREVMVKELSNKLVNNWPPGERLTKKFPSLVEVDCPAPVTGITIGTWGFVRSSFSFAESI